MFTKVFSLKLRILTSFIILTEVLSFTTNKIINYVYRSPGFYAINISVINYTYQFLSFAYVTAPVILVKVISFITINVNMMISEVVSFTID